MYRCKYNFSDVIKFENAIVNSSSRWFRIVEFLYHQELFLLKEKYEGLTQNFPKENLLNRVWRDNN